MARANLSTRQAKLSMRRRLPPLAPTTPLHLIPSVCLTASGQPVLDPRHLRASPAATLLSQPSIPGRKQSSDPARAGLCNLMGKMSRSHRGDPDLTEVRANRNKT